MQVLQEINRVLEYPFLELVFSRVLLNSVIHSVDYVDV
jgi:hypothetical protein